MKEIKAYVRVIVVDDVLLALEKIGAPRMTAIDVKALGNEIDLQDFKVSMEYGSSYTPMVKIEIICSDEDAPRIIEVIRKYAYSGRKGDGIIAVSSVNQVISIRTGKTGDNAI